jgi:predicted deacylase
MALVREKTSQRIKYSFLKILTGSDLSIRRLALMEAKSPKSGPVVWLTGCMHGDEVGGIVVIQEIFKKLQKEPLKKGELFAFPLMNPIGFETGSRHIGLSKEDLNRSFPGNPTGSLAERIAEKIFSTIMQTGPTLVLDLHNDWIKSIPYALIDPCPGLSKKAVHEKTINLAKQTGLVVISEPSNHREERSLSGSLISQGVPAITLELGEPYVVNEKNVEDGVSAVWNILWGLEMTGPRGRALNHQVPVEFKDKMLDYSHQPGVSTSGIVRFFVKPGQPIKRGDKVARIYNVFGKLQETIVAERNGLVLGHSDTSVALPGAPVAAFGFNKL